MEQKLKRESKKVFLVMYTLMLLISMGIFTKVASAEEKPEFEIKNPGILTKYNGKGGAIRIPDNVKVIEESVFEKNNTITSVYIPDSVLEIKRKAFKSCENLTTVRMPVYLSILGESTFESCKKLKSITIPEGLEEIENGVFWCCENLSGEITIPKGVDTIGGGVFVGCMNLKHVSIPEGVVEIKTSAFTNTGITSIDLPESLQFIGQDQFVGCDYLTSIYIPKKVLSIGADFANGAEDLLQINVDPENKDYASVDGILYNKDITELLSYPCAKKELPEFPSSVHTIGDSAFRLNPYITNITIPDSIRTIEWCAFYNCSKLETVVIPDTVTNIQDAAFIYSKKLKNVTLSNNITEIGQDTFYYCKSLENIDIPDSITSIGESAFEECSSLQKVKFPKELKKIEKSAFCGTRLENIIFPDGLTTIEEDAFYEGRQEEDQRIAKKYTIPASVTLIEEGGLGYLVDTIYGYKDTYAEKYAQEHNIPFVEIKESVPSQPQPDTNQQPSLLPSVSPSPAVQTAVPQDTTIVNSPLCIPSSSPVNNSANNPVEVKLNKITYVLNKGNNNKINQISYPTATEVVLGNPSRKGYSFAGWYTDRKLKHKIKNSFIIFSDMTLYAKWSKVTVKKVNWRRATNTTKRKIILSWKPVKGVKGYQIQYTKKKKTTNKNRIIIEKLKKGKTYTVRIRAFKIDSTGKKVYGKWSVRKKVLIRR